VALSRSCAKELPGAAEDEHRKPFLLSPVSLAPTPAVTRLTRPGPARLKLAARVGSSPHAPMAALAPHQPEVRAPGPSLASLSAMDLLLMESE